MSHFLAFKLKPPFPLAWLFATLLVAFWLPSPWLMAQDVEPSSPAQVLEPSRQLLMDEQRQRAIPIAIHQPQLADKKSNCVNSSCPVAILSAGYGLLHTDYAFLATSLSELGYLVIAVGHELPTDPPLSVTGDVYQTRSENWQRGAQTLRFIRSQLKQTMTGFDFDHLLLIGHSNGGDISAWLANEMLAENEAFISTVVTLDSRRVPLPRSGKIKLLTLRGSDFPADVGVLPTALEQQTLGLCVVTVANARHDDMYDGGPDWLKTKLKRLLKDFLVSRQAGGGQGNYPSC
jgi:dienelactone hydrolase